MNKVIVLSTGGTVAMQHDSQAGGAVPALSGAELTTALPQDVPQLTTEEICNLPSSHFTLDDLRQIQQRVTTGTEDSTVRGVVVTHGTDTLEETAYLLDLTVPGATPVVVTGAMRTASELGADGPANLEAAVRVAASEKAQGLGALVVMNGQIHAARFVTKMDTLSTATFQSPGWGPLGRIVGNQVRIAWRLDRETLPHSELEERVALIKLTVGMESHFLEDALARDMRGIVLEGLGAGRIPPWWLPSIERAVGEGVTVVIASRCPSGPVWDAYGYRGAYRSLRELGCLFSSGLNGQKARVRLMVVLGSASTPDDVAQLWSTASSQD